MSEDIEIIKPDPQVLEIIRMIVEMQQQIVRGLVMPPMLYKINDRE